MIWIISGFKGVGREQKNREENEDTSEFYAEILHNLRKIGKPVPTNDIWIAAAAFLPQPLSQYEGCSFIEGCPPLGPLLLMRRATSSPYNVIE